MGANRDLAPRPRGDPAGQFANLWGGVPRGGPHVSEKALTRAERHPHTVDENTWWYREPRGGLTLVRQELDGAGKWVRTKSYRLHLRAGRIELRREVAPGEAR